MRGKRPTRRQKQMIADRNLNPDNWLISKVYPDRLLIQHRYTGKERLMPIRERRTEVVNR